MLSGGRAANHVVSCRAYSDRWYRPGVCPTSAVNVSMNALGFDQPQAVAVASTESPSASISSARWMRSQLSRPASLADLGHRVGAGERTLSRMQSLGYYTTLTWVPTLLQDHGMSAG
jgi:hypothetical protein